MPDTPDPRTPAQELADVLRQHKLKSQTVAPVQPEPAPGIMAKLKRLWS